MEGKIVVVAIVVSDQAASLEFFTSKVGFEKKSDITPPGGSRWVTVGPKGQDLEIALWQSGSTVDPSQKELAKDWGPAREPPIVIRVGDCRAVYEELRVRGVPFLGPIVEQPWGAAATFRDPDGNLFTMSQPPGGWPRK